MDAHAACEGVGAVPPATIEVVTEHAIAQVDHSRSAREIRHRLESAPHTVALGLTQSSTTLSVDVVLRAVPRPGGDTLCARPALQVTLRHPRIEILVARELEPDGCIAALVLAHEMRHVAIERDTLDWAAQQLELQLQRHYQASVLQGTEAEIKAALVHDFDERWTPALRELLESSNARHAAFDAQESYGDTEACGGDLLRTARELR
jgi:hypothetical protein